MNVTLSDSVGDDLIENLVKTSRISSKRQVSRQNVKYLVKITENLVKITERWRYFRRYIVNEKAFRRSACEYATPEALMG